MNLFLRKGRNLKCCMVIAQFRPAIGGAERQAEKLAIEMGHLGLESLLLTPRIDPASPRREISEYCQIVRFPLFDISKNRWIPLVGALNWICVLGQACIHVRMRLTGIALVHCHIGSVITLGAAIAAWSKGIPSICKVGVAGRKSDIGELQRTGLAGRATAALLPAIVTHWVATSNHVRAELLEAGIDPARISIIPNGVEVPLEGKESRDTIEPFKVLYLGRLSSNAGRDLETVIYAVRDVAEKGRLIEFAVVGDGDSRFALEELANALCLSSIITFKGVGESSVWLEWADCFVLPSRWEGLSNSLLEAMSFGLPCIANDIPSNREALNGGRAGILVPVGDVSALTTALMSLLESVELRQRLGLYARARIRECYSIQEVAERYLTLYKRLL